MKIVKVGAGVLNQTPLAWESNAANIVACIEAGRQRGVTVLCLPELCISGYGCEDAFLSRSAQCMAARVLHEVAPATAGMIVSVGLPVRHRNAVFNAAALIVDRAIVGLVAKRHLAGDGLHYEPRWFKPWPRGRVEHLELEGNDYPIGDLYFDVGGLRIGFEICEDAWVAPRPGADLADKAIDIIFNPSASHFAFGKHEIRRRLVLEGARAFGVTYVYANLLGNEAGRAIYDGDALVATMGHIVACARRFSFADFQLCEATVDVDRTRMQQAARASLDLGPLDADRCVAVPFRVDSVRPEIRPVAEEAWTDGEFVQPEEFTRAVALGLFDYVRKSGARGFVVSLSGGCDSSAVACLVAIMARLAVAELGLQQTCTRLGLPDAPADVENLIGRILTTVYQSTRHSSTTTREAASGLARAIGARHRELDVDPLVDRYTELVGDALGREPNWQTDDVALQNIQARARGPGVWMIANLLGALLLAASNRSEAAVGYATMDGDTCGGLSPIAGIDKAFLREYLRWLQTRGPREVGAIAALEAVNRQEPTAELRPAECHQTDEGDLMPYSILDAIERAAIRDRYGPIEVFTRARAEFPDIDLRTLADWVERFFVLWCRNQWKRERYAPSFHLDDENLDPKTWCRFPILSSGFNRELRELRELVQTLVS